MKSIIPRLFGVKREGSDEDIFKSDGDGIDYHLGISHLS